MNKDKNTFRAFFAINPPEHVIKHIIELIDYLKKQKSLQNVKWVPSENLHITMRFLGNITWSQYEQIITQITIAIKDYEDFYLKLSKLILFPSPQNPLTISLKPEPITALIACVSCVLPS